ncbi:MAG: hypothetical protein Q8838_02780, partial [Candidatus Phytoplasma australasiaticum]|nr:hypothetical protein [Candidatus Phytoplasma australasiaticum]
TEEQRAPPAPQVPQAGRVAHGEFQDAITILACAMTNQINPGAQAPYAPTPVSRVQDFTRRNPLEFHKSKAEEDPQEFIDKVYKVLSVIGINSEEKEILAAYQLKGVA